MQANILIGQPSGSTTALGLVLFTTSGSAVQYNSPQTLGLWQTYAARINSSSYVSIYHNANLYLQQYVSGLNATYLYDRTFYSCRIGQSWWSFDGYADMDLRALLIYDYPMTDYDFDQVQQYIYNLTVDDPPLLSPYLATAQVRWEPDVAGLLLSSGLL